MKPSIHILILLCLLPCGCFAQSERSSVRAGNRDFRKEAFDEAEINYKKALVADSLSVAADYNLGNTFFRMENYGEADRYFAKAVDSLEGTSHGADIYHNMGNSLLKQQNYQGAIEAYKNSLRRNPGDMQTKSNLAYAQKMLQNQQDNQDQNQNQNQNQNQDQDQDQNQNQDQQPQEGRMTPQQAQQLLKAVQAEDRKTQDKVNKEKAAALKSRQKEKNW